MDYAALAAKYGGKSEAAPVDYAALAAKFGGKTDAAPSFGQMFKDEALTSLPGGIARGLKDIVDTGAGLVSRLGGKGEAARIEAMNQAGKSDFSRAQETVGAGGSDIARIAGNVIGTLPVGGVLAKGVGMIPGAAKAVPSLINALRSGGMTTGAPAAAGLAAGAANLGVRTIGGGVTGAAMAAAVDPNDWMTGGVIGAVAPGVLQLAGKFGSTVYNAVKNKQSNAGKLLAEAMGVGEDQLPAVVAALKNAPDSIVDGSRLTVSQALQQQGAKVPQAALLERTLTDGPGGGVLQNRYMEQGRARMRALVDQGAETYQGAAKSEGVNQGNKLAALLRTQAGDDQARAAAAWGNPDGSAGGVYGRALADNVRLNLPLDELDAAMSPLGRGSTLSATDARGAIRKAYEIGSEAGRVPVAAPFGEFQRLRRDTGSAGRKLAERAGNETEAGVLNKLSALLTQRADDAAGGIGMAGDNITPEFLSQYNAARGMTRMNADLYKGGNIAALLRKSGGEYALGGDEVMNKLWHGGMGLDDDVARFSQTMSGNNREPAMNALRKFIMTDAAGKTTASGEFGAALPKYVESRLPGLQEALAPDQFKAVTGVASDIRNAEAAANFYGRGSDSKAKIEMALSAGVLDSGAAKALAKLATFKGGMGLEMVRGKLAELVTKNKGKTITALMAEPKLAAIALEVPDFVSKIDGATYRRLQAAARASPVLGSQMLQAETQ